VGHIRDHAFPKVVFNLYLDQSEYRSKRNELPEKWRERFEHYYKTYKEDNDIDFEPILRASLRSSQIEALYNMTNEPVRVTPKIDKGVVKPKQGINDSDSAIAFISYSREDWDEFVSELVTELSSASQRVWLDRDYILGGDDWMNAIGEALNVCDILILVLSPEALKSRNIRMEYRYFLRQEKPIIPILYRNVKLPFELAPLHFLDFTKGICDRDLFELVKILDRHRSLKRTTMLIQPT